MAASACEFLHLQRAYERVVDAQQADLERAICAQVVRWLRERAEVGILFDPRPFVPWPGRDLWVKFGAHDARVTIGGEFYLHESICALDLSRCGYCMQRNEDTGVYAHCTDSSPFLYWDRWLDTVWTTCAPGDVQSEWFTSRTGLQSCVKEQLANWRACGKSLHPGVDAVVGAGGPEARALSLLLEVTEDELRQVAAWQARRYFIAAAGAPVASARGLRR